jgi:soluble lytic murein transglycosylase-like protein
MRAWFARARGLRSLCIGLAGLAMCLHAQAGAQREEVLTDAVRSALAAAIGQALPPEPVHTSSQHAQAFANWLASMQPRLQQHLQRRAARTAIGPAHELDSVDLQREFLQTVWYESQRAGLEASLVLGLVEVESGFRKFAISSAGARGYMQVMPFWSRLLAGGDASELFHAQANLRYGCVILRHYLDLEGGDLTLALGRFNGSRGQLAYPNAVRAAQKKWALVESPR